MKHAHRPASTPGFRVRLDLSPLERLYRAAPGGSRYPGARLRELRAERGVGRPPKARIIRPEGTGP